MSNKIHYSPSILQMINKRSTTYTPSKVVVALQLKTGWHLQESTAWTRISTEGNINYSNNHQCLSSNFKMTISKISWAPPSNQVKDSPNLKQQLCRQAPEVDKWNQMYIWIPILILIRVDEIRISIFEMFRIMLL